MLSSEEIPKERSEGKRTPASTLVKSSTLVPESGSVGVFAVEENVRNS